MFFNLRWFAEERASWVTMTMQCGVEEEEGEERNVRLSIITDVEECLPDRIADTKCFLKSSP